MSDFIFNSTQGASLTGPETLTVTETGSVATVTIAVGGTYEITLDGGAGGGATGTAAIHDWNGGLGASVGGDIYLAAGTVLNIVVGDAGGTGVEESFVRVPTVAAGGGGGGTFVFMGAEAAGNLLAVAGGGGGAGRTDGGGGQTGAHGASSVEVGSPFTVGVGGAGLHGGGVGETFDKLISAGGGGGFTGGNAALTSPAAQPGTVSTTGYSFQGGVGVDINESSLGQPVWLGGHGGFGGGGGGGIAGGGGGGGYGGGGGGGSLGGGGGGGGSYLSSSLTSTFAYGGATTHGHTGAGEFIITAVVCFAEGTRIHAAPGEVAIETLAVGDLVISAGGEARPIKWIGHRRIDHPSPEQMPVRVMAGAFGERLPVRELHLSPGHAVCVSVMDEVFVPIGELINGTTIAQAKVDTVTYWHIELESHDVLLADGMPCESYMDAGNRAFFGRQHGRIGAIDPARAAVSLTRYARPFVNRGPVVKALRKRLVARAEAVMRQAAA